MTSIEHQALPVEVALSLYHLLVFLHVLGAIGIFVALAIESVSLGRLRNAATLVEARAWVDVHKLSGRLGAIAMIGTIGAGIGLVAQGWGRQPWILGAIVGLVGMMVVGASLSARRARRLRVTLADAAGPDLPDGFRSIRSPTPLTAPLRLRIALGIGIVGLMTVKPGAVGAALILIAAALSGLVAGIPFAASRLRARA